MKGGRSRNVTIHSTAAPKAAHMPNLLMIARSETHSDRKPITVVSEVRKQGSSIRRNSSTW